MSRPARPTLRARVRRLAGALARSETRPDALRRVRARVVRELRRVTGRPSAPSSSTPARPRAGAGGAKPHPDSWYVGRWTDLAATVLGPAAGPPDPAGYGRTQQLALRQRAEAGFAQAVMRGEPLERAVADAVAALADAVEYHAAWSLAEGAGTLPDGRDAAVIGHGVLLHRRRQFARAWTRLRTLDDAVLARFVPVEAVDGALAAGAPADRARARAIAARTDDLAPSTLVDLAGRFLALDDRATAAALVAALRRRTAVDLDDRRRHAWRWIEGWLEPRPITAPPGATPVAVIDYRSPDHVLTSGNLGDRIQTLAMVGTLARLQGVTFTGEEGLGELATELQARVRPELRAGEPTGAIHLLPVDRDATSLAALPDRTWLIAFGWHMHPLFDLHYDFPYHPNLRPIYLSFHVNRLDMLSEAALDELRRHGPIGCRDWSTVDLLLSAGVDAFFSGCLTTTVDGVFPRRADVHQPGGPIAVIDLPATAAGKAATDVRVVSHQSDEHRYRPLAEALRVADETLATHQREVDRAVTGRLHAYLPLTALGVPVEFRTGSPGDVRFAGLAGLTPDDPRLDTMRTGLRDLVAAIFTTILSGASDDAVYERWRDLTASRVAEARARFLAPVQDPPPTTIDVAGAVAASRAAARRSGPHDRVDPATVTDVVIAFDENLTLAAAVLTESLVANASGPLRLWILERGLSAAYQAWFGGAFPDLPVTFLPCAGISYGPNGRPRRVPRRITVSTMDRLLLPSFLEDVSRVVYLDVDTLLLDDVTRLARTDLGGHPVAARDSNVSESSEWQRAGRTLPEAEATELRRAMGLRHGYGQPALNAGVLVLDLDRMRRDGFTERALAIVEQYGLHDQDTMLAYVGPERARLDPRWNAMPVLEDIPDPWLIHWASFGKPWEPALTFAQATWQEYATRLRDRAGLPPTAGVEVSGPPGSLHHPVPVGPVDTPRSPAVERVIDGVRREHLSYLDASSLRTLAAMVESVDAQGIDGLIVEAGTALGGSAITMAAAKAPGRSMKVYDVFGMIPPPGERDGADVHRRYATITSGGSKGIGGDTYYGYRDDLLGEVTASFARHGVPVDEHGVELVPGLFQDTMSLSEPVALAHLDGDWYASTMTCLERVVPNLARGGRIVIDDYDTWSGCRAAVDEYFAGRPGFRFERRGRLHVVRE